MYFAQVFGASTKANSSSAWMNPGGDVTLNYIQGTIVGLRGARQVESILENWDNLVAITPIECHVKILKHYILSGWMTQFYQYAKSKTVKACKLYVASWSPRIKHQNLNI